MKIRIRRSNSNDFEGMFECHKKCFPESEHWYKSLFIQHVESGFVIEIIETKEIIGLLMQGPITPSESKDVDDFFPVSKSGEIFKQQNLQFDETYGIVLLCILPEYRKKGLAKKLIELHFQDHPNEVLCLNTRKSNPAFNLYIKMGYEHVATIKDKYYFPTEDSYFMIKK